jgi:hypothetical protein
MVQQGWPPVGWRYAARSPAVPPGLVSGVVHLRRRGRVGEFTPILVEHAPHRQLTKRRAEQHRA